MVSLVDNSCILQDQQAATSSQLQVRFVLHIQCSKCKAQARVQNPQDTAKTLHTIANKMRQQCLVISVTFLLWLMATWACRYNHLQAGFMSNTRAACSAAEKAGMALLPVWPSGTAQASNSECSSGWPPPQRLAQRAMQILGQSASGLLSLIMHRCPQHISAVPNPASCMLPSLPAAGLLTF